MMRSFVALCLVAAPAMAAKGLDSARIEQITGLKGQWTEKEGVFKVQVPRSDLAVTAAGAKVTPPLGLTTWAAFTKAGAHTVVMGDIVLTEDQVNPAMDAALQNGLEVTALQASSHDRRAVSRSKLARPTMSCIGPDCRKTEQCFRNFGGRGAFSWCLRVTQDWHAPCFAGLRTAPSGLGVKA